DDRRVWRPKLISLGRQFWPTDAWRPILASADGSIRPRKFFPCCGQHVVPVEPGSTCGTPFWQVGGAGYLLTDWGGRKPVKYCLRSGTLVSGSFRSNFRNCRSPHQWLEIWRALSFRMATPIGDQQHGVIYCLQFFLWYPWPHGQHVSFRWLRHW